MVNSFHSLLMRIIIYSCLIRVDVNVPYPEGTDEDLIEDEDDPDKDTDFVHR